MWDTIIMFSQKKADIHSESASALRKNSIQFYDKDFFVTCEILMEEQTFYSSFKNIHQIGLPKPTAENF